VLQNLKKKQSAKQKSEKTSKKISNMQVFMKNVNLQA